MVRFDTDTSDSLYWNCDNKILEETDEESVSNLTPRLDEVREKEVKFLEEAHNKFYMSQTSDGPFNNEIYASKATLETENSSE
eukprot:CAMPEP_0168325026 /NCGR_PEP_ID=MMETSP0213-20121227/4445_1 /TAXON_ID=151035 /ORGANISM="Euplotes harpa, Strain FSP1.4" /LENGTH=82 /DNA_ID=CAMNT_0008327437 /DNA_START=159 /DNA_END=407 /DNA_ORIENTATION=+